MSTMGSQFTSLIIVYSTTYSRRRSKKSSNLCVPGLCAGNSPVTGEFPAQRASNTENVSIWWYHHDQWNLVQHPDSHLLSSQDQWQDDTYSQRHPPTPFYRCLSQRLSWQLIKFFRETAVASCECQSRMGTMPQLQLVLQYGTINLFNFPMEKIFPFKWSTFYVTGKTSKFERNYDKIINYSTSGSQMWQKYMKALDQFYFSYFFYFHGPFRFCHPAGGYYWKYYPGAICLS